MLYQDQRISPLPDHWIGVQKGWEYYGNDPRDFLVSMPISRMTTHALIIGATGSGKTNLLHHLVSQDILAGHSFCVLDLRGDLVAAVTELIAGRVDPRLTKIIDLREKVRPTGFSPLHGAGEPYFRALNVLHAVESESDSWGVQLSETMRMALMLLAEVGEPLTKLESLFHDRHFLMKCVGMSRSGQVTGFWQRFSEMGKDRQAALAMPVTNKLSMLMSTDSLRKTLGHPKPMDLGRHLDMPGSVTLVSLAVDELHGAGRMMGRMLLSSIQREIFARVNVAEGDRNPVRIYVDEFEHFGSEEFENILAEGRRFKASLVLAHQTLAQLSPRMRAMVLGNVGTKFVLRTGREDGAVLSKDLTGDPKAVDFTSFSTGDALMWSKGTEPILVEINEPIVGNVGLGSEAARAFVRQVRDLDGPVVFEEATAAEADSCDPRSPYDRPAPDEKAFRSRHVPGPERKPERESPPPKPQADTEERHPTANPEKPSVAETPEEGPDRKEARVDMLEDWLCG